VVEDRPIMSVKYIVSQYFQSSTFGHNQPTLQRGLSAMAELLVCYWRWWASSYRVKRKLGRVMVECFVQSCRRSGRSSSHRPLTWGQASTADWQGHCRHWTAGFSQRIRHPIRAGPPAWQRHRHTYVLPRYRLDWNFLCGRFAIVTSAN